MLIFFAQKSKGKAEPFKIKAKLLPKEELVQQAAQELAEILMDQITQNYKSKNKSIILDSGKDYTI